MAAALSLLRTGACGVGGCSGAEVGEEALSMAGCDATTDWHVLEEGQEHSGLHASFPNVRQV